MDDVVVLAVSSSRSDPIQHRKWRRLREMHTYSAPMTPPSRSSEIWWSGRWDWQHDGVVSMVESMRRQGFACLRGGERTEKGGFRKRAAAPQKLGQPRPQRSDLFYRRPYATNLHRTYITKSISIDQTQAVRGTLPIVADRPCALGPKGQGAFTHASEPGTFPWPPLLLFFFFIYFL
jgi:hypothetical protein